MSRIRSQLLAYIDRFQRDSGISDDALGRKTTGDNKLIKKLRAGHGITLTTLERVEAYITAERQKMSEHAEA